MEKQYDILDHLYKDFNKGNVGRFTSVLAEGMQIYLEQYHDVLTTQ